MIDKGGTIELSELEDGDFIQIIQFDEDDIFILDDILMTREVAVEMAKYILETYDF